MEPTLLQTYLCQFDIDTFILAATAIAALYSIRRNTIINRRRATVDLVLHQKNDSDLKAANLVVNPLLSDADISITLYSHKDYIGTDERKSILFVLNNYEFVATGIREKAFDYKLFRRMRSGTVIRDWDEFKHFIYELRKVNQHSTMFQEFEWLAKKLKKKPLKPKNND